MGQLGDFIWFKQGTGNIFFFKITCISRFFLKLVICGEHVISYNYDCIQRGKKKKKKVCTKAKFISRWKQLFFTTHRRWGWVTPISCYTWTAFNRFPSRLSREKHITTFFSFFLWQCICKTSGWRKSKREAKKDERWRFTWQEKRLVHSELVRKSDMAEVFLALANGRNVAALPKDLHDELLGGVLWQTADKHGLTPWRALPCGWRGKVCSKDVERRQKHSVLFPRATVRQTH